MVRFLAVALVLVSIFGCGKSSGLKMVPVSGSVVYKGNSVEGAHVTFVTSGSPRSAVGVTDSSGKFRLTTINTNDGALAGEHIIVITKMREKSSLPVMSNPEDYMKAMAGSKTGKPPSSDEKGDRGIPAKYADAKTSGLKRTVVAGEKNDFTFELSD